MQPNLKYGNAQDAAAGWDEFWHLKYDGGKKKVKNTNPDSRDEHPEVSASTAYQSDAGFKTALHREFLKWQKDSQAEAEPVADTPDTNDTEDGDLPHPDSDEDADAAEADAEDVDTEDDTHTDDERAEADRHLDESTKEQPKSDWDKAQQHAKGADEYANITNILLGENPEHTLGKDNIAETTDLSFVDPVTGLEKLVSKKDLASGVSKVVGDVGGFADEDWTEILSHKPSPNNLFADDKMIDLLRHLEDLGTKESASALKKLNQVILQEDPSGKFQPTDKGYEKADALINTQRKLLEKQEKAKAKAKTAMVSRVLNRWVLS